MKRKATQILFIAFLGIVLIPGLSCKKEKNDEILSGCIKGKLVVLGPCAQYVIQVLDGDVKNAEVAANWLDPETNINYTNVFTVANYCYFPPIKKDEVFYFYFVRQVRTMDCIVCLAARATPTERNEVKYTGTSCP